MDGMPAFSPDGKWIAYASNEDGDYAVYVRRYPDDGRRVKISTGWSGFPKWPKQGNRIFFVTHQGRIVSARYRIDGDRFTAQPPETWPDVEMRIDGVLPAFDVTPDGRAVIVPLPVDPAAGRLPDHLTVIRNFFETLRQ
jgi:hypothetical protein